MIQDEVRLLMKIHEKRLGCSAILPLRTLDAQRLSLFPLLEILLKLSLMSFKNTQRVFFVRPESSAYSENVWFSRSSLYVTTVINSERSPSILLLHILLACDSMLCSITFGDDVNNIIIDNGGETKGEHLGKLPDNQDRREALR